MKQWSFQTLARTMAALALSLLLPGVALGDIPWEYAEKRVAQENASLAARPGGHGGTYFVICTLYYTPMESGFRADRGFDATPESRPGLGGRKYPREFLLAVRKEGIGRLVKPVNGRHYIRYEGRGRFSFCHAPTGLKRGRITARKCGAVRSSQLALYRPGRFEILDPDVIKIFGSRNWHVGDTGGGLRKWQIDLYWGEDEPMGPGSLAARPRGTTFEYGFTRIKVAKDKPS